MKVTLFSVNKATLAGYVVVTSKEKCEFIKDNDVRAVAYKEDKCYVMVVRAESEKCLIADSLIT